MSDLDRRIKRLEGSGLGNAGADDFRDIFEPWATTYMCGRICAERDPIGLSREEKLKLLNEEDWRKARAFVRECKAHDQQPSPFAWEAFGVQHQENEKLLSKYVRAAIQRALQRPAQTPRCSEKSQAELIEHLQEMLRQDRVEGERKRQRWRQYLKRR